MKHTLPADKIYFTIGEVAEAFELSTATIRHWEKSFDTIRPKKNKKGDRFFSHEDIANIQLIYSFVKEQGLTLRGAAIKLKENKSKDDISYQRAKNEVIQSLMEVRAQLEVLRDALDENSK